MRIRIVVGAAVALTYLGALVLSLSPARHRVRPLYEGFGPAAPYPWVNPPPAFAAGNTPPQPQTDVTDFKPTGFGPVGLTGAGSQVILNLPAGAIVADPGDTGVKSVIVPLDPATLGPITSTGLTADGNAYRFDLTYQPSQRPVTHLVKPGQLLLGVPTAGHQILFSKDGQTWVAQNTQQLGQSNFLITAFDAPGYYLAAGRMPIPKPPAGNGPSNVVPVAVGVAILALVLIGGPIGWRRRRARDQGGHA